MELKIGDKYKMVKKVGSGAFGEIYKGKINRTLNNIIFIGINLKSGEEVAIKLVIINRTNL